MIEVSQPASRRSDLHARPVALPTCPHGVGPSERRVCRLTPAPPHCTESLGRRRHRLPLREMISSAWMLQRKHDLFCIDAICRSPGCSLLHAIEVASSGWRCFGSGLDVLSFYSLWTRPELVRSCVERAEGTLVCSTGLGKALFATLTQASPKQDGRLAEDCITIHARSEKKKCHPSPYSKMRG